MAVVCVPLLLIYIAVAMCNHTVVQSYLGTAMGRYFSKEWGGRVRISSLHISPLGHVKLRGVGLVSPTDDTIFIGDYVYCDFKRFPIDGGGLELSRVRISDAYYHLGFREGKINLRYIVDYFKSDTPKKKRERPFVVKVGRLILNDVRYRQDLKRQSAAYANIAHGVNVSHMDFTHIDANLKDVRVEGDNVDCRIVRFYAEERSGFRLRDLSADIKVSHYLISAQNMELTTDYTHLLLDATLEFDGWKGMKPYCENVVHTLTLRQGSRVGMRDAAYWAPMLWGVDETIAISGNVRGPVADMEAEGLEIAFGSGSRMVVDGRIEGLPEVKETRIDACIKELHTTWEDLSAVHHPEGIEMKVPELVRRLDTIDMGLEIHGGWSECEAAVKLRSRIGGLSAQVSTDVAESNVRRYSGHIESDGIEIDKLLDKKDFAVARSGLNIGFEGSGTNLNDLRASAEGELTHTTVRGRGIANTTFAATFADGKVTGQVEVADSLVHLALGGWARLGGEDAEVDIEADLEDCDLTQLLGIRMKEDEALTVGTHLSTHIHGTLPEYAQGEVRLDNTRMASGDRKIFVEGLSVRSEEGSDGYRTIKLESELCDGQIGGYFDYSDLVFAVRQFRDKYLGGIIERGRGADERSDTTLISVPASFEVDLAWEDGRRQLSEFFPLLEVAPGTSIHATYNSFEPFGLAVRSDSVRYASAVMRNIVVGGGVMDDYYRLKLEAEGIAIDSTQMFQGLNITCAMFSDRATCHVRWDDNNAIAANEGDLGFLVETDSTALHIHITEPTFYLGGVRWELDCDEITLARGGTDIEQLTASTDGQYIAADLHVAHTEEDYAAVAFHNFSIDRLDSILLRSRRITFDGRLNGKVLVTGFGKTPYATANLSINDCKFNDEPLGTVAVASNLDGERQILNIYATSKLTQGDVHLRPISASGTIDLKEKDPAIDIEAHLDQFDLQTIAPFLTSFTSRFEGRLNSDLAIGGTIGRPQMTGAAYITKGILQLDATGVTYSFNDSLRLTNSRVVLDDFRILDPRSNALHVDGSINLSAGERLGFDLRAQADNLMLYNRKPMGESPYGTMFAQLSGTITGTADKLAIAFNAKTNAQSEISIPINNRRQSTSQEYIHFISKKDLTSKGTAGGRPPLPKRKGGKRSTLDLTLDIDITPKAKFNLPMDFSRFTTFIDAVGKGNVSLHYATGGKPTVVGAFEFTSGSLALNLLSLFEKSFTIDPGSTILLPGDVTRISFDIRAVYGQRANLSTLTTSTDNAQRNINVENIITLAGTLNDPSILFDIRLPNADQMVSDEVFSVIDRSDQQDMINQTISLLLLGQFYNKSNNQVLSNAASGSYNLVASSLSSVVSNMIKVVNVNFGYKAATGLTNQQFDVDISKEWERFYFETTIGYGGNTRNISTTNDNYNYLVGDILLGYKITPSFHLFAFNRTNSNDYTRIELPYKQGFGLKYTRDFNNWKEFFKRIK